LAKTRLAFIAIEKAYESMNSQIWKALPEANLSED
jgi:hypothetical protein